MSWVQRMVMAMLLVTAAAHVDQKLPPVHLLGRRTRQDRDQRLAPAQLRRMPTSDRPVLA